MATKAYILLKGFTRQSGYPAVIFDCFASFEALLINEVAIIDPTTTVEEKSLAIRTVAAERCNLSDPTLNLVPDDFAIPKFDFTP